jgi:hypothetical protein
MSFLTNITNAAKHNAANAVSKIAKPEKFGAFLETESTDSSPASTESFSVNPNYNTYASQLNGNANNINKPGFYYPWNYPTYSYPYYIPYYSEYPTHTVTVENTYPEHPREMKVVLPQNTNLLLACLAALLVYFIYSRNH